MKSKTFKRLIFMLPAFILLTAAIMLKVSAASIIYGADQNGKCGSEVEWSFFEDTGNLIIHGTGDMDNYTDKVKTPWYAIIDSIKSIEIRSGVTSVGDHAFSGCSNASKVSIASSITKIGAYSFNFCPKIKSFSLPYMLTSIGEGAFANCSNISYVSIPSNVSEISQKSFYKCTSITRLSLPDNLISIGDSAFFGCPIEKLTLPDSLTSIGANAFSECDKISYVKIPKSIVTIGDSAFSNCFNLSEVSFPNTEIAIEDNAFSQKTTAKLTFSGYMNSFAHKYALENNIKFNVLYSEIIYKNSDGSIIESLSPGYYTVGTGMSTRSFAVPKKDGYSFGGWYIDEYLTAAAADIPSTASDTVTLYAKWIPNTYSITYYEADGRKMKNLEPSSYTTGDTISPEQLPVLPDNERKFLGWYSDSNYETKFSGISASDFGDRRFYAKRQSEVFSITAAQSDGGKIEPHDAVSVDYDSIVTYKIIPNDGYTISNVFIDGVSIGASEQYTFQNVDKNHTISAQFASLNRFSKKNEYVPGKFYDIDESDWFGTGKQGVIAKAYELGIMNGYQDGTFYADGNIRISEAIKMAAVVHNIYNGGTGVFEQGEPWYQVYVNYAVSNGIIKESDFDELTAYATRAEMAYIFANSINEPDLNEINNISSIPDVSIRSRYGKEIYRLYNAGVLTGNDAAGTFAPDSNITRAQAAAIISRIVIADERRNLSF